MGASTGNMLVDRKEALEKIYAECARLGLPLMTHCEDTNLINHNMAEAKAKYGEDPDISLHPFIRSEEACYNSFLFSREPCKNLRYPSAYRPYLYSQRTRLAASE